MHRDVVRIVGGAGQPVGETVDGRQARLAVAFVLVGRQLLEHALAQLGLQAVGQQRRGILAAIVDDEPEQPDQRHQRRAECRDPAPAAAGAAASGASAGTQPASWRRSSGSSTTRRASEPCARPAARPRAAVSPSTASSPTGQRATMPASARRKITSSCRGRPHAHLVHQRGSRRRSSGRRDAIRCPLTSNMSRRPSPKRGPLAGRLADGGAVGRAVEPQLGGDQLQRAVQDPRPAEPERQHDDQVVQHHEAPHLAGRDRRGEQHLAGAAARDEVAEEIGLPPAAQWQDQQAEHDIGADRSRGDDQHGAQAELREQLQ